MAQPILYARASIMRIRRTCIGVHYDLGRALMCSNTVFPQSAGRFTCVARPPKLSTRRSSDEGMSASPRAKENDGPSRRREMPAKRSRDAAQAPRSNWQVDYARPHSILTHTPPCRWARSGRVLRSFAKSPEPQSSVLKSLLGARTPNSQIFLGSSRFPWAPGHLVA